MVSEKYKDLFDSLYEISEKNEKAEENFRKAMKMIFGVEDGEFTVEKKEGIGVIFSLSQENGAKISYIKHEKPEGYSNYTLERPSTSDNIHTVSTYFRLQKTEYKNSIDASHEIIVSDGKSKVGLLERLDEDADLDILFDSRSDEDRKRSMETIIFEQALSDGCSVLLRQHFFNGLNITLRNGKGDHLYFTDFDNPRLTTEKKEAKACTEIASKFGKELNDAEKNNETIEASPEMLENILELFRYRKNLPNWFLQLDKKIGQEMAYNQAEDNISQQGAGAVKLTDINRMVGEIPTDPRK